MPQVSKPECPKCGSDKLISNGDRWLCRKCGKQTTKIKQPSKEVRRPDNPCPECKSTHVISNGRQWVCRDCGKHWNKLLRLPTLLLQDTGPLMKSIPLRVGKVKRI